MTWLPYLIPPFVGALIGYVTNYVAIRMLFRPLHPWRIFGLRLPLTPGVIPARRGELAIRMGEMVGSHLLTTPDVVGALEGGSFRRELHLAVSDKLAALLDRDLGPACALVPAPFAPRLDDLAASIAGRIVHHAGDFLAGDAFAATLQRTVAARFDAVLERSLASYADDAALATLIKHLETCLEQALQSAVVADAVGQFIDSRSERLLRSEHSLRELLPAELVNALLDALEKEVPPLLDTFGGLLYDPAFRQRLTTGIRQGLRGFLDSLTGLTGLLSGFLNLEQIDSKIPAILDQVGEEAARWLREPGTQAQVAALLRGRIEAFLARSPASIVASLSYEKVDGVRCFLRSQAVTAICSPGTAKTLGRLLNDSLQRFKERSFSSLLGNLLPASGRDYLVATATTALLRQLRSPQATAAATVLLTDQLQQLLRRPLGRLSARVPADLRDELDVLFCQQAEEVLRREVPALLGVLNIRQMVEDKVNQLDILQVEELLLSVMKEQFTYINLFGALLGFLLGLLNILLLQLI
jgi:uncharacterized membrane protein YheB (UPF0754 family)